MTGQLRFGTIALENYSRRMYGENSNGSSCTFSSLGDLVFSLDAECNLLAWHTDTGRRLMNFRLRVPTGISFHASSFDSHVGGAGNGEVFGIELGSLERGMEFDAWTLR